MHREKDRSSDHQVPGDTPIFAVGRGKHGDRATATSVPRAHGRRSNSDPSNDVPPPRRPHGPGHPRRPTYPAKAKRAQSEAQRWTLSVFGDTTEMGEQHATSEHLDNESRLNPTAPVRPAPTAITSSMAFQAMVNNPRVRPRSTRDTRRQMIYAFIAGRWTGVAGGLLWSGRSR